MNDLTNWTPRPMPASVRLEGRYVMVIPYQPDAHDQALWDAFGGLAINQLLAYFACPDFYSVEEFSAWSDAVSKAGWLREVFVNKETGAVVGMAHYMRADPANGVVEVGGVAHGPAMARTPMSTEAHYLMAKHVFEDLGYRRYEWKCHNENAPSKRTAERYGFTFEGVFRQHAISRGKNRDTAWFSMIDTEWPLLAAAFETWLSPQNFDSEGRQQKKLEDIRAELATG
ncbi:GNAT family N-acetyltransferase [Rhizobium sp. L1K21]|uniref:GNAT family N-acetyltransferase n=1 Tax=Rhizobium sp. L1K21 TaxID=2954933 RepID=UPI0020922CB9|nr:GNAT family protein [Rhizobium sp. L1K21]MCO6184964.1 GNAT family N-acetyltransferase [Rhizobium sp. L1K21]